MNSKERVDQDDVQVNDKRRFSADGEPLEEGGAMEPLEEGGALPADERVELEAALARAEGAERRAEERATTAEAQIEEIRRAFRRFRDEQDAIRSRLERDVDLRVRERVGGALESLLGPLDDFDRALSYSDDSPLAQGMALVRQSLLETLARLGLEKVEVVGQPFDPETAEAIEVVPAESPDQDDVVTAEMRSGYRLDGKLLRAAQVRVAKKQG